MRNLAISLGKPVPSPEKKLYRPKHPEIAKLDDYREAPSREWWSSFPKLTWKEGKILKSQVNPTKLFMMATRIDYPDIATVMEIVNDIKNGCDIHCRGENLCPSLSLNAPSAYENGEKVTDAVANGIFRGIMIGRMEEEEVPFDSIKVNGIMVKLKPDDSARIIMNMSKGFPYSVNDGIDNEQFEVYMSSTIRWLRALHMAGKGCFMTKADWKVKFLLLYHHIHNDTVGLGGLQAPQSEALRCEATVL